MHCRMGYKPAQQLYQVDGEVPQNTKAWCMDDPAIPLADLQTKEMKWLHMIIQKSWDSNPCLSNLSVLSLATCTRDISVSISTVLQSW